MRALHTTLALETGAGWTPMVAVTRGVAGERTESAAARRTMFRNMALFLCSPFIGLLYAVLLPFVGLGMLAWFAARALVASSKAREMLRIGTKVLLLAAAPFAGLAYLVVLPFAGLGMIAWFVMRTMAAPAN